MTNRTTDPRALQLAKTRQQLAHQDVGSTADWNNFTASEQRLLTEEAATFLRAAVEAGIAPTVERPTDEQPADSDTLPAWLYQRFAVIHGAPAWDRVSDGDRAYWEHHAQAVRRAVARGGFKAVAPDATSEATSAPLSPSQPSSVSESAQSPTGAPTGRLGDLPSTEDPERAAVLREDLAGPDGAPSPERDALIAELLPAWEAMYEPGNVSTYLIGYANDEAPAKAAAEAWLRSQAEVTGRLEWEQWSDPATLPDGYDALFELIQRHDDGIDTGPGIAVRRRIQPAT